MATSTFLTELMRALDADNQTHQAASSAQAAITKIMTEQVAEAVDGESQGLATCPDTESDQTVAPSWQSTHSPQ